MCSVTITYLLMSRLAPKIILCHALSLRNGGLAPAGRGNGNHRTEEGKMSWQCSGVPGPYRS
jgi:hypothetical protein